MGRDGLKKFLKSKPAQALALGICALLLLLAVYKVFFSGESASDPHYRPTEREARLCKLLSEVEGIENATAMISEEGGVPVGAVIIFEGADSVLARIRVLEITAATLKLEKKFVQVYPASRR